MKFNVSCFAALAGILLLSGCATEVTRVDTDEVRDLSGAWKRRESLGLAFGCRTVGIRLEAHQYAR